MSESKPEVIKIGVVWNADPNKNGITYKSEAKVKVVPHLKDGEIEFLSIVIDYNYYSYYRADFQVSQIPENAEIHINHNGDDFSVCWLSKNNPVEMTVQSNTVTVDRWEKTMTRVSPC
jgi:hypothetical protein